MNPRWYKVSLSFFLVVAFIGTLLRATHYINLPLEFEHLVHAHSHVAFQGWVYTLLMLLTTNLFLSKEQIAAGKFLLQYKITVIVIIGVLISFSFQGYGLYSIIFSTLFQLMNYWFIYSFFKGTRNTVGGHQETSLRFVKTGMWFGLLSTIAPWGIGVLSAKGYADSEAYHSTIYFFLHFQYNGWFLIIILGILFKNLELESIYYSKKKVIYFLQLMTLATLLAYPLSLLGMSFRKIVLAPAFVAVILQLVALVIFAQIILPIIRKWFANKHSFFKLFISVGLLSFVLKVILQSASIVPMLQDFAFGNRFVIVSYLHLCLIGMISFMLIAFLYSLKYFQFNFLSKFGSLLLLVGFIASEILLVTVGLGIFHFPTVLLLFTATMAFGILLILINPK